MEQLVNSLTGKDFLEAATKIEEIIKPQIQTQTGLIRDLRDKLFEDVRKKDIIDIEQSFCKNPSTNNRLWRNNNRYQQYKPAMIIKYTN